MKNYRQSGETLSVPAPFKVAAGEGVLIGALFGIAQHAAEAGEPLELVRRGVFSHAKTPAQLWSVGDKIYWHVTSKTMTTTESTNALVGLAVEAAANPSEIGVVLLDGALR